MPSSRWHDDTDMIVQSVVGWTFAGRAMLRVLNSGSQARMDWHNLMSTIASEASDLELLKLRTALDHLMLQPNRIIAIRRHLHVGQAIEFLDVRDNTMRQGRVIEFKPDQLLIQAAQDLKFRWMPYACVKIDPVSMPVQPQTSPPRPRREDFALGDTVSFEGRDLIRSFGKIIRINQKTASLLCEDGREWRVSFALLQRVINV